MVSSILSTKDSNHGSKAAATRIWPPTRI